jgi:ferredoxin
VDICPEVFEMGEKIAQVKMDDIDKELEEAVRQAAEACPTSAIIIES